MGSKANYTLVGLFVIGLGVTLVWLILWIAAPHNGKSYKKYLVYMDETVSGLSEQAPVKYNGVTVGSVQHIKLNPKNPQEVVLLLNIVEGTPITTSTIATLKSQGVTGINYVGLKAKTADAPMLTKTGTEPYPVIPSEPSLLVQLGTALHDVTENIKQLSTSIHGVFDEENQEAFKESLQNIEKFTKTLSNNSREIDRSLKNADTMLANTAKASKKLPQSIDQFNDALVEIKHASKALQRLSNKATSTLSDGEVVLSNVNSQTLPSILQTSDQLSNLLGELAHLTNTLKRDPSIIIRGVKRN